MTIDRRIGLVGLIVTASISIAIPITNIRGYINAKERLDKYQSVDIAIQSYRDECVVTGFPWDQIHDLYFGIGKGIAYRQFAKKE